MARLRYNGLTATLGAALTSTDTTITFAAALTSAAGAVPTISGSDTIALSILDATSAVSEIVSLTAYTTGATTGTIARAQESTTATAHSSGDAVVHSPTAADFASSSSSGVLAVNAYDPGTLANYPATTTTAADVDATNMAVSFTAPASGKVLVTLQALYQPAVNSAGYTTYFWTLQEAAATVASRAMQGYNYSSVADQVGAAEFYITGLTPGSSHTYKWGHRTDVANKPGRTYAGGGIGAAIMKVTAAP